MVWNKRKYARCPLPAEKSAAVLVMGKWTIPCLVQEVSLSGFGVVVTEQLPAAEDLLGKLTVGNLVYVVRVTRQEAKRQGVLVALEQVEEIVPDSAFTPTTMLGRWMTRAAWVAAVGIVAAAMCRLTNVHEIATSAFHL